MPHLIRTAMAADLAQRLAPHRHLHAKDPTPAPAQAADAWSAMRARPGLSVFLGERCGEAVASCTLIQVPNLTHGTRPCAFIENVVTHAALACAWAAGCYKAMPLTGSKQESTLRFYGAAGFRRDEKSGMIARPPV